MLVQFCKHSDPWSSLCMFQLYCSHKNLYLTADLLAIKMKHWLQGYKALHEDTCQAPHTYSLDSKTSTYGNNYVQTRRRCES